MKKGFLGIFIFFMIIFLVIFLNNQTFNDLKSMEAKIAKELNNEQVTIFGFQDIKDSGEYRIVGYTYDNNEGYAVFKKNDNGDFLFDYVKNSNRMIPFAEKIFYDDHHTLHWIIISTNENLHTIQFKINYDNSSDDEIITIELENNPSIIVVKMPRQNFGLESHFYDYDGNLIE